MVGRRPVRLRTRNSFRVCRGKYGERDALRYISVGDRLATSERFV